MVIGLYTKAILTTIAIALVIIALNPWLSPSSVQAQYEYDFGNIASDVDKIEAHVRRIHRGSCTNSKIC